MESELAPASLPVVMIINAPVAHSGVIPTLSYMLSSASLLLLPFTLSYN